MHTKKYKTHFRKRVQSREGAIPRLPEISQLLDPNLFSQEVISYLNDEVSLPATYRSALC